MVEARIDALLGDDVKGLSASEAAIVRYVPRAVLSPHSMQKHHLEPLYAAGLDARGAHDVVNVLCCFSYMNRLADCLGVTLTEERHEWAREFLPEEALQAHIEWARGETAPVDGESA